MPLKWGSRGQPEIVIRNVSRKATIARCYESGIAVPLDGRANGRARDIALRQAMITMTGALSVTCASGQKTVADAQRLVRRKRQSLECSFFHRDPVLRHERDSLNVGKRSKLRLCLRGRRGMEGYTNERSLAICQLKEQRKRIIVRVGPIGRGGQMLRRTGENSLRSN
jgi:hypothetical protein